MATYRAYFLDSEKHIFERKDFEAATDDDAVQHATRRWQDGHLIEVWQEGTFVGIVTRKR